MPEIMPNLLAIGDQLLVVIPAVNCAALAQHHHEPHTSLHKEKGVSTP